MEAVGSDVKGNATKVSAFTINNVSIIEGEAPSISLGIIDYLQGGVNNVLLKVDEITPASLKRCILRNNGLCLEEDKIYTNLMEEYCRMVAEKVIEVIRRHKKLGWHKIDGKPVFLGDQAVSTENIKSQYEGDLDIKPKGSIENITQMIKEHILTCKEWSPLQAVIAFSVGATVLPFAKMFWGVELNNIVIHLLGGSTTGKSTSLKLHAGLGANACNKNKGFWITHESSLVAIIRRIGNNFGFPVSIDELSATNRSRKDYDEFVYALGNGEEKDRMKAGGVGLQKSASFSTVILSSGELSILKKCSANEGIRVRCIEIANEHWTESKEQANAIAKCIRYNHGLVPPLVAEELLKNSEEWRNRWEQLDKKVQDKIAKDKIILSIVPRVADFVILFTLAAELANKVLGISLDTEKIFKFCYEYIIVANADEANLGQRVYEYIMEYFSIHRDRFALGEVYGCKSQWDGYTLNDSEEGFYREAKRVRKVNGIELDKQIVLRKSAIERILGERGFSVKVALNKLKEAGYLQTHDKKRTTSRATINDIEQDVVIIYYREDTLTGVDLDEVEK